MTPSSGHAPCAEGVHANRSENYLITRTFANITMPKVVLPVWESPDMALMYQTLQDRAECPRTEGGRKVQVLSHPHEGGPH